MSILSVALDCGQNKTWLTLPATTAELNKALLDINALDKPYTIGDYQTSMNVPHEEMRKIIIGGDINELNYLAARLAELPQSDIDTLAAVMETPDAIPSIAVMIDFTYNTEFHNLMPEVHTTVDLAQSYIFDSGLVNMPDKWKNGIDLYAFGTNLEELSVGVYTTKGFLSPSGDEWNEVFEKNGVVPQEYRIENYMATAEKSVREAPRKQKKPSILGELKAAIQEATKTKATAEKKPQNIDL